MTPRQLSGKLVGMVETFRGPYVNLYSEIEELIKTRDQACEAQLNGQLEGKQLVINQLESRERKLILSLKEILDLAYPPTVENLRDRIIKKVTEILRRMGYYD